jgi:hypothetical protein
MKDMACRTSLTYVLYCTECYVKTDAREQVEEYQKPLTEEDVEKGLALVK